MTAVGRGPGATRTGARPRTPRYLLAVLLAALSLCLGTVMELGASAPGSAHSAPVASAPVGAALGPGVTVLRNDCPAEDSCCVPAVPSTPAVRPGEAHPASAVLPQLPRPPGATAARPAARPSGCHHPPDLHLLQVLRT